MIAMGVDPGGETGWAVIEVRPNKPPKLLDSGRWKWEKGPFKGHPGKVKMPRTYEITAVEGIEVIGVELPHGRAYKGRPTASMLVLALRAGMLFERLSNVFWADVVWVPSPEWQKFFTRKKGLAPKDATIDGIYQMLFNQEPPNEHERDAALIAYWAALNKEG